MIQSNLPPAAGLALDLLERKRFLERCFWNGTSQLSGSPAERAHWHYHSSIMMSTVGAFLENRIAIANLSRAAGFPDNNAEAHLRHDCRSTLEHFSVLPVLACWHPEGGQGRNLAGYNDEHIRSRWIELCDAIAAVAGLQPTYGIPASGPVELPKPSSAFKQKIADLRRWTLRRRLLDREIDALWDESARATAAAIGVPRYQKRWP